MRRHVRCLWKLLAIIPLMGVYNLATCQANTLRHAANALDEEADELDGGDEDLGDLLSDLVEDW